MKKIYHLWSPELLQGLLNSFRAALNRLLYLHLHMHLLCICFKNVVTFKCLRGKVCVIAIWKCHSAKTFRHFAFIETSTTSFHATGLLAGKVYNSPCQSVCLWVVSPKRFGTVKSWDFWWNTESLKCKTHTSMVEFVFLEVRSEQKKIFFFCQVNRKILVWFLGRILFNF